MTNFVESIVFLLNIETKAMIRIATAKAFASEIATTPTINKAVIAASVSSLLTINAATNKQINEIYIKDSWMIARGLFTFITIF